MKIGIITLPLLSNYGGILQAWALQTVLTRMGHDVKVVDRDWTPRRLDELCNLPIRIVKKYILKKNTPIFYEQVQYLEYIKHSVVTKSFIKEYIQQRLVHSFKEIHRSEFDGFIFGSDQIWRPAYIPPLYLPITNVFGAFVRKWNVWRVSYAASFGLDDLREFKDSEIKDIKRELQYFRAVSVRESSGVVLCKKYFDVDAVHVLDPTLLLEKNDYLSLARQIPVSDSGILEYILDIDPQKEIVVDHFCQILKESRHSPLSSTGFSRVSVEEWIAGFRDTKMVVTDSFHACVFSIIFQKPFVVIANPTRGISRIKSLLGMFNLQHHLVTDISQIKSIDSYKIDAKVYDSLAKWKSKSMDFLISALEK